MLWGLQRAFEDSLLGVGTEAVGHFQTVSWDGKYISNLVRDSGEVLGTLMKRGNESNPYILLSRKLRCSLDIMESNLCPEQSQCLTLYE